MVKRVPALIGCSLWMLLWWQLYPRLGPILKSWALTRLGRTADYFFTYLGPELFVFVCGLVVLPALYLIVLRRLSPWAQGFAIPLLLALSVIGAYWDVLQIAREAERRCTQEAGLRVYRRVEAEGIAGVSDIRYWADYGFKWVEYVDERGRVLQFSIMDDRVKTEILPALRARFEYREQLHKPISKWLEKSVAVIADRSTGEILGAVNFFHIFRGWADRLINLGLSFSPPICWVGAPPARGGAEIRLPGDLVKLVIQPSY